jgi:non-homologous end joining protein Ku
MVSIPFRLYKAARRERTRFHYVYRRAETAEAAISEDDESDGPAPVQFPRRTVHELPPPTPATSAPLPETVARVRNMPVMESSEQPIEKDQMLKGLEIEKDRFVTFKPQEIAAIRAETSTELTIAEFVQLAEINPIYFETSYYAVPYRGGEKPYALLFAALSQTNYVAVGSLAMHGREPATVIRPGRRGLILHTLFYENEVRADEEYQTEPAQVNAKELD